MVKSEPDYNPIDYLNEKEKELFEYSEYFSNNSQLLLKMFADNNQQGKDFIKAVDEVRTRLGAYAYNRWQRYYLKEGLRKDMMERESVCEHCKVITNVKVVGEEFVQDKFHFDKLQCSECNNVFVDIFPNNDEDFITWVDAMKEWIAGSLKDIDLNNEQHKQLHNSLMKFQTNIEDNRNEIVKREEKQAKDIADENSFQSKIDNLISNFSDMKIHFEKSKGYFEKI